MAGNVDAARKSLTEKDYKAFHDLDFGGFMSLIAILVRVDFIVNVFPD